MTWLVVYLAGIVAFGQFLNADPSGLVAQPSSPFVQLVALFKVHPEVAAVLVFLAAVAAHVLVGALLHATRLHDFDWGKLGQFVEHDFASTRGLAILVTFLTTLATTVAPGTDFRAAFAPAFLALAASCGAATLPVVRDTLYELIQLVSGANPAPVPKPLRA